MKLSNVNFSLTSLTGYIKLAWDSYSDIARYVLVKKKISVPMNQYDGNRIYIGTEFEYIDKDVKNGEVYYYRLFILYDESDDDSYISDSRCILKTMAFTQDMSVYGKRLYESVPENVRLQDANLRDANQKDQNKPLKRFFETVAYPFDKIDTNAKAMLQQIDMETCDEQYLPYHAKWLGQFYDEKFGSDINRLMLITMNDAEPYLGTVTGLKYVLQRIFKVDIEVKVEGAVTIIYLFLDDENPWLSDPKTELSIRKIIVNFCALRTNYSIKESLISDDKYDRAGQVNDPYMFGKINELVIEISNNRSKIIEAFDKVGLYEKETYTFKPNAEFTLDKAIFSILAEAYIRPTNSDTLFDMFKDAIILEEIAKGYKEKALTHFDYIRPVSMTCSPSMTSNNFMTTATRYDDTESEDEPKNLVYRYSANPDGSNMTESRQPNSQYVGVGYMPKDVYEHENLYSGTKDFSGNGWNNLLGWYSSGINNGLTIKKRTGPWSGLCQNVQAQVDEVYTLYGYVKTDTGAKCNCQYYCGTFVPGESVRVNLASTYKNGIKQASNQGNILDGAFYWMAHTFKVTEAGRVRAGFENSVDGTAMYVCGLMLVKGAYDSTVTWTPSTSDWLSDPNNYEWIQIG